MIIYKYPLPLAPGPIVTVKLPAGGRVLSVQLQNQGTYERPMIWVLADQTLQLIERHFAVLMTGETIPANVSLSTFRGSLQHSGLVYHVFEQSP